MNNSLYGKTMENVRKHGDFEIVNTPERFQKLVNKPLFKHRHIINEDLVVVEKENHTVELNNMGMSILDFGLPARRTEAPNFLRSHDKVSSRPASTT